MGKLKMVIPKGSIYENVVNLLNDAGFTLEVSERSYVPRVNMPDVEA